jgi:hypothetical protein
MQVQDSALFVNKIVGAQGIYQTPQITQFLRGIIVAKLTDLLGELKTGLFDAVKVKEKELDALYEFDNKMLDFVGEVAADVDQVASAVTTGEGIREAIANLVGTLEQANQTWKHREEAMLQSEAPQ